MLFAKSLFKKSGSNLQHNTYKSIDDLPQWNWNQIHKTENYSYLKKLDSYRNIEVDQSEELQNIWHQIYDEFIEEFGFSKEYMELLEAKKRIAQMKLEYITKDDASILDMIDIEEMDLKAKFSKEEGVRFEAVVMALEKRQGMPLDLKTLTVYKYNSYIRTIKEEKNG